ncbi:branched-chain-amino-acid transaminase [Treponema brennaborense]|uniref:Branched-chain-amino-acid aminotransferase n=1 Tax=Treponema brennaborense (strain DSM 12168 / CIP 105900 / DD5/3) TaxID=906968 RepID=F4LJ42_TREBD|nr:branched-chain-amino-acid transaminase [Treponema brennaborense]AEE16299.1 branched-chain amino acid aminotransferase [Treponema brennaborense DSM 12168]
MAFNLEMYPITYVARYDAQTGKWNEQWLEADTVPYDELLKMTEQDRQQIFANRNQLGIPAVSYTSQYGYGCFEGMKAYPRKDGKISIFRPDRNAKRFADSMRGLYCPAFPEEMYVKASVEFIKRNAALGYVPSYNAEWEKDNFASAHAVYMRPYMNSEAAIGVGISKAPYVVICATSVSSYFKGGNTKAVTTNRIRATPHGTGCIKCASNYVISALAKKEAEDAGYMEVVYLDAVHHTYVQEGSSCNIFFLLKNGTLVTPELGDTILPGITRASVIELARQNGVAVAERPVSIKEVMSKATECFVTGTAAGITPIESITHNGKERVFNDRKPGALGEKLQKLLKSTQYGAIEDKNGWNVIVE